MSKTMSLAEAKKNLEIAEKNQDFMKVSNAILRKSIPDDQKIKLLVEDGTSEAVATQIMSPDFMGRKGFAQYKLTSNNDKIKRLKDLVTKLEGSEKATTSGQAETYTFEGGTIEVNYEANRVQIKFPGGRTDKETYQKLRKNGWVFSPTNQAFQRQITPQAISNAIYLFNAKREGGEPAHEEVVGLNTEGALHLVDMRKFSYVTINMFGALPKELKWAEYFNLAVLDPVSANVKTTVKEFIAKHLPEIDQEKVKVSVYSKTYVRKATDLVKKGFYLPSQGGPEAVIPGYEKIKEGLTDPNKGIETKLEEPTIVEKIEEKKPQTNTHFLMLKQNVNSKQKGSIGEVMGKPNMFVTQVLFGKDKTGKPEVINIDNNYLEKLTEIPTLKTTVGGAETFVLSATSIIKKITTIKELNDYAKTFAYDNYGTIVDPEVRLAITERLDELEQLENMNVPKETLGSVSGGAIMEYADIEGDLISELEEQGDLTTSDAQGILEAHEEFAQDQFGLGIDTDKIAKKILALGETNQDNERLEDLKKDLANAEKLNANPRFTGVGVPERIEQLKKEIAKTTGSDYADKHIIFGSMPKHNLEEKTNEELHALDMWVRTKQTPFTQKRLFTFENKEQAKEFHSLAIKNLRSSQDWAFDKVENPKYNWSDVYFVKNESDADKLDVIYMNVNPVEGMILPVPGIETIAEVKEFDFAKGTLEEFTDAVYNKGYNFEQLGLDKKPIQQNVVNYHATTDVQNKEISKKVIDNAINQHYGAHHFHALHDNDKGIEVVYETGSEPWNVQYKNQYELNKAIEKLITEKGGNSINYTSSQKAWIRKYSGYGGLDKFAGRSVESNFEFYTPIPVIKKMWALAYKYGYNNGPVLEPSVGTGEFLAFAKPEIAIDGYEISEYSATICRILYPEATIINKGFEQQFISKNWTVGSKVTPKYDMVIGNPPYGIWQDTFNRYMQFGEAKYTNATNYQEYFIRRSIDLLKPGGLLVFIIGTVVEVGGVLFLDGGESKLKDWLAENTELLDAYRLPEDVFERTKVTSEIIVIKKL